MGTYEVTLEAEILARIVVKVQAESTEEAQSKALTKIEQEALTWQGSLSMQSNGTPIDPADVVVIGVKTLDEEKGGEFKSVDVEDFE